MATKTKKAAAGGKRIFKTPEGGVVALDLARAAAIHEDGKGKWSAHIDGVRHSFLSDEALEDLAAGDAADE